MQKTPKKLAFFDMDDTKVENIDTAAIVTLKTHKHIY